MKHLIDTTPKLAECARCHAYVLAGMDSGTRYAVDVKNVGLITARALVLSGQSVYSVAKGGKIKRLSAMYTPCELQPPGTTYLMDHGCGCSALDASAFEEREIPPLQAPVTPEMDVFSSQGLSAGVVTDANSHRSELKHRPIRCANCDGVMQPEDEKIMVETPVWQVNTLKVPNRGSRKGYTREFEGWGWTRWAIHPDGCHARTPTKQRSRR